MALTTFEQQPNFPHEDLSQSNAAFFEFFLQDQQLVDESHPVAENMHLLYSLAHSITNRAQDVFTDERSHAGFTHGFTLYEIIATMIREQPYKPNVIRSGSYQVVAGDFKKALHGEDMTTLLTDAYDELRDIQPITAEVVKTASERHHPNLTYYAVMGAAIERQLEIEAEDLVFKQIAPTID